MEQQTINQPNNQNLHAALQTPTPHIQNSILTQTNTQHESRALLGRSKIQSSAQKKGQYVISYNFDHCNPAANNAITHNIFIGWDDQPTRKKPIKKFKSHQVPSTTINSKTPLRNKMAMISKMVSEQDLKNEEENDSISINQLTKRVGNEIKEKYNSMFIQQTGETKSKQCSLYGNRRAKGQEQAHMPILQQKSRLKEKEFISLNMKNNQNKNQQARNSSCKILKPIPNPVLQTLRKSENECKEKPTPKYLNQIAPVNVTNKENNNRVKLESFSVNRGKNTKIGDQPKNIEQKMQYRNGRTIQHKQIPKIPNHKPLKPIKNQLMNGTDKQQKVNKKQAEKSVKQRKKRIFNTADQKVQKNKHQSEGQKLEECGQFSDYGADTLKLIEQLEKMESEDSLNESQPVDKQSSKKDQGQNVSQQLKSVFGNLDKQKSSNQNGKNIVQKTNIRKDQNPGLFIEEKKKNSEKSKNKQLVQGSPQKKKVTETNFSGIKKPLTQNNSNKVQKLKQPKKQSSDKFDKNKAKQLLSQQKDGSLGKKLMKNSQNADQKKPNIHIPKLNMAENNENQQAHLKKQQVEMNNEQNPGQNSHKDQKLSEKMKELEINKQTIEKGKENQHKCQQQLPQKINNQEIVEQPKTSIRNPVQKGQQIKRSEAKDKRQQIKAKKQIKKELPLSSPRSPKMFNAVYLQQQQKTIPQQNQVIKEPTKSSQEKKSQEQLKTKHGGIEETNDQIKSGKSKSKQSGKQAKLQQGIRSPRELGMKSNQISMKITSRESKSELNSPGLQKRQQKDLKNTTPIDQKPKKQQNQLQNQRKSSQSNSRLSRASKPMNLRSNINDNQKNGLETHEKTDQSKKTEIFQEKNQEIRNKKSVRKNQSFVETKNIEQVKVDEEAIDKEKNQQKISTNKPNQIQVKKSNSGAAIHRKKLDLKLMNGQEQGVRVQQANSKNEQYPTKQVETLGQSKIIKENPQANIFQKQLPLKQTKNSTSSQQQKRKSQISNKAQQKVDIKQEKQEEPINKRASTKNNQIPTKISSDLKSGSSRVGNRLNNNPSRNSLSKGQKNRKSEYADSDSQLQATPISADFQAPKLITCISKKSNQSQSSVRSNHEPLENTVQKTSKAPQPKPIRVKQLKNASVQINEIKKENGVEISVGTSRKQIEKTKRKSTIKKLMVDQEVQYVAEGNNNQCKNNIGGENANVSVDDNIFSFANISCEPNIQQIQKQSFLDIGNTDKLNRTDFLQPPKIIQRKFNNNNSALTSKNKAKDRSLFDRAPVLSFVYDQQKKLTQQQNCVAARPNQITCFDPCPLSSQFQIIEDQQNCIVSKALRIVLEIDPWLIDRIIEPYLTEEGENQLWLYCKGHWKCFRSNHLDIISIFRDVLKKALHSQYNQTNPNSVGIEQVVRMITGFRVMQLKNKKKLSQELSYHISKGYSVKGISYDQSKPIYSVTALETTAKMEKLIKIQTKERNCSKKEEEQDKDDNILWIKQEVFEKYFDYFLLICCRDECWWTSKSLRSSQLSQTLVYTIDSLTNSIGSLELHADCELSCKIDLYREVKPKVLKFVGSVNERNKPTRSTQNPNPSLCFNFAIKGRFSELPLQLPALHLSMQSSKEIRLQYLETIQPETYKNSMSEYIEINNKTTHKSIGSINKSKSTIKNRESSMFGKEKQNIKEQFIKFLMEDARPQKK